MPTRYDPPGGGHRKITVRQSVNMRRRNYEMAVTDEAYDPRMIVIDKTDKRIEAARALDRAKQLGDVVGTAHMRKRRRKP